MAPWARAGGHGFRGTPAAELLWPCGRLEGWRGAARVARVGRRARRLLRALLLLLLAGARTAPGDPGGGGSLGNGRPYSPHLLLVPGDGAPGSGTAPGALRFLRAPRPERAQRPKPHSGSAERGARNARPRRGCACGGRAGRWRWRRPRTGSSGNAELSALPALFKESPDVSRAGPPSPCRARGPGPPPAPLSFSSLPGACLPRPFPTQASP